MVRSLSASFFAVLMLIAGFAAPSLAHDTKAAPLKGSVWETTSELADGSGPNVQHTARRTQNALSAERSATLQALQIALNKVPDGRTFVWNAEPLSVQGRITPTHSFRDDQGRVCRHLQVDLARAAQPVRTHTVACRQRGRWQLEG